MSLVGHFGHNLGSLLTAGGELQDLKAVGRM
jgi:hypothetical protein